MIDFDGMTRKFLLGERKQAGAKAYLRAIQDGLRKLRPVSQSQAVMIENMISQIKSVAKEVISLQEKVSLLEEQISVLEESKDKE
tara:strand:- start:12977 stop:13231 length:255 start_codon:yes stop_codon:yes gene_type:complete